MIAAPSRDGWRPASPVASPVTRVAADLRARVRAGEWSSGQALPAMIALAEHYKTSRSTVAKALKRMEADGLIEIVPQWGTFRT